MNKRFCSTERDDIIRESVLTLPKIQWHCSSQQSKRKTPNIPKCVFFILLMQRNKLKCSEGWKGITRVQQKRSSQQSDIRPPWGPPGCHRWAEQWGGVSGWRLGHSMQQSNSETHRAAHRDCFHLEKFYKEGHWDAPSHAESGGRSSDTLFSFCPSWLWRRKGHSLAVSPNHIHADQPASACQTAAKGTQNSQVSLFPAEDINLSLLKKQQRAAFNETQGNIIGFEVSTPLLNLSETDQHIQKLLESEWQIDKWT